MTIRPGDRMAALGPPLRVLWHADSAVYGSHNKDPGWNVARPDREVAAGAQPRVRAAPAEGPRAPAPRTHARRTRPRPDAPAGGHGEGALGRERQPRPAPAAPH